MEEKELMESEREDPRSERGKLEKFHDGKLVRSEADALLMAAEKGKPLVFADSTGIVRTTPVTKCRITKYGYEIHTKSGSVYRFTLDNPLKRPSPVARIMSSARGWLAQWGGRRQEKPRWRQAQ